MILISSGLLACNCLQVWADRSMGAATPCTVENPAISAATTMAFMGCPFDFVDRGGRWVALLSIAAATPQLRRGDGRRTHRVLEITDLEHADWRRREDR